MFVLKKRDGNTGLFSWETGKNFLVYFGYFATLKLAHKFVSAPYFGQ